MREYPLFRSAFLFVSSRAADCGVELPLGQCLSQSFGLHHMRVGRLPRRYGRNVSSKPLFVDVYAKVHAVLLRGAVAERDHLLELPGRVDVEQRKRNWRRK